MNIFRRIFEFFTKEKSPKAIRHTKPEREKTFSFNEAKSRLRKQEESLKNELHRANLNIIKFERIKKSKNTYSIGIEESIDNQKKYVSCILEQIKNINQKIIEMDINKANLDARFGLAEITFDNEVEKDKHDSDSIAYISAINNERVAEFENMAESYREVNKI